MSSIAVESRRDDAAQPIAPRIRRKRPLRLRVHTVLRWLHIYTSMVSLLVVLFFAATGVTDGELLQGVRYPAAGAATTESLVTRSRSSTVRVVQARHDQAKLREITGGRYG